MRQARGDDGEKRGTHHIVISVQKSTTALWECLLKNYRGVFFLRLFLCVCLTVFVLVFSGSFDEPCCWVSLGSGAWLEKYELAGCACASTWWKGYDRVDTNGTVFFCAHQLSYFLGSSTFSFLALSAHVVERDGGGWDRCARFHPWGRGAGLGQAESCSRQMRVCTQKVPTATTAGFSQCVRMYSVFPHIPRSSDSEDCLRRGRWLLPLLSSSPPDFLFKTAFSRLPTDPTSNVQRKVAIIASHVDEMDAPGSAHARNWIQSAHAPP